MIYGFLLIAVVLFTTAYVCFCMVNDFIQKPYRKENSERVLMKKDFVQGRRQIRPELVALAKKLSIEDEIFNNGGKYDRTRYY